MNKLFRGLRKRVER